MKNKINIASKILESGNLIIFPTETVYGIGADATNVDAIKKIYKIKNRPQNNPIFCHFKSLNSVEKNFYFNETAYKLANNFWPGPLTLILEKKEDSKIKSILSNNKKFVGCRVPNHPIAQDLLKNLAFPIAAPSANISTKLSSTKISHLSKKLKENVFILDGGETLCGLESTVIDVINDKNNILRLGSISFEKIKKIVPNINIENKNLSKLSPGQYLKHYSPSKPIRININSVLKDESLLNFGSNNLKSNIKELNLSPSGNLEEAAKNFYNYLHILDKSKKCKRIAVAPIPNIELGKTINDRLNRASFKR